MKSRGASKAAGRPGVPDEGVPEAHGWKLGAHPLLIDQLEKLTVAAEQEDETGANRKLLAHLLDLMLDKIPQGPDAQAYRHGGAIDGGGREWYRGKTGNGRYRLFYRFSSSARVIVYAWMNDKDSLRTRGSKTDAYAMFAKMLRDGDPSSNWDELEAAASQAESRARLDGLLRRAGRGQR